MRSKTWPIRLTSLLYLTFVFISAGAQTESIPGAIEIASNINKEIVAFPLNKANSNYMETGPLISSNGKRLYFSRYGHPSNTGGVEDIDIWYNDFNDSTQSWSDAKNVGAPLNNKGPNFVCEIGWTNDTLMLANRYDKKGRMKAGLSVSVWNGKSWSVPTPIQVKNDYNMAENVGYDISSYRNVLLISEEKADSHGKTDLYVAFRDRSSARTATESFNLGEVINSTGSERSPFLTDDTKTLYFASDGHNGYGKLDIFRSRRLDDTWTNWSKPENLGPGINTPYDDRNFGFGSTSRYAYYSRGINASRTDIYLVPLSALFVSEKSGIQDLSTRATATEPGQTLVVTEAFSEESAEITESAQRELRNVISYMERLNGLVMFLSTHSNLHKNRSQSFALSNKRLEEVKRYLVANGIDKSRIQGESEGHDVTEHGFKEVSLANSLEFRFINKVIVHTASKKSAE